MKYTGCNRNGGALSIYMARLEDQLPFLILIAVENILVHTERYPKKINPNYGALPLIGDKNAIKKPCLADLNSP